MMGTNDVNRQFDMTGQRFGKLVVIGFDHYEKGSSYWKCQCDCGGTKIANRKYLQNGHTLSCGCIRGKGNHKFAFTPRNLSEEETTWLIKHYKHTKNDELIQKLQVSESFLHRFSRKNGLSKTKQFRAKMQREASAKANASHKANGTYPPKGYHIPRSEENQYRTGPRKETAKQRCLRIERSRATHLQTIKLEKARISFGLPQRTKLRLIKQDHRVASLRWNLRKRGYIISRGSMDVYYDENTQRWPAVEARQFGDRNYVAFRYLPYEVTLGK